MFRIGWTTSIGIDGQHGADYALFGPLTLMSGQVPEQLHQKKHKQNFAQDLYG